MRGFCGGGRIGAEVSLAGAVRVGGVARGIRGCILNDISFAEFWQVRFRYQTLGSLRKFQTVFFDLELSRVFSLSYLKIRWRIEKIKKSSKSVFAIALTF